MPAEVMDAPVETSDISTGSTEPLETGADSATTVDTASESVDSVGTSDEKEQLTEKTPVKGKLNLADVAKKSADALKAINPLLPSAIQKASYELGRLYGEFPGGLKEAVALKGALNEFGGVEGVKETIQTLSGIQPALQAFFDGKGEFVDALVKESPESFSKIMPAGLEKWKQVDPEMYNYVQARVLTQTLDGANVAQTLSSIWSRLDPEKQKEERSAIAEIWNLLDGFRKVGEKAPERKTNPKNEELTRREQELTQREAKALLGPIANEGRQQIATITDREMRQSYQWDQTDSDVQEAVRDAVQKAVIKASGADNTFTREFERLKERGDAQGLSRHVKNFQERITPNLIPRVAKLYAVKPKGAVSLVKKTSQGAPAVNGRPPERGWERVSAMPKANEIDRRAMGRDYEDMILSNKAILKGGRKIVWA